MTGTYIGFEGVEGAGKSSVAAAIAERLAGVVEVVEVREPGGTGVGERIRSLLLDPDVAMDAWTEALLFASARAQLAAELVGPALARGAWVVSDRTVYSSLAYQGMARGLGVEAVRRVNETGLRGVWPDRVVLLQVDAAEGLRRQHLPDRIGAETDAFHERVADAFAQLAAAEPDRFVTVDAGRSLPETIDAVWKALRP